jgi:hypothetical protein
MGVMKSEEQKVKDESFALDKAPAAHHTWGEGRAMGRSGH